MEAILNSENYTDQNLIRSSDMILELPYYGNSEVVMQDIFLMISQGAPIELLLIRFSMITLLQGTA